MVSARELRSMARGRAVPRSAVQRVARRASWARKKGCYAGAMSVNPTHPDYDGSLPVWLRARDVIAGEDAVKSAGEKYLPRLEAQTDEEYAAYRARASFFNATTRTADGYLGLLNHQGINFRSSGRRRGFLASAFGATEPYRCLPEG